jgi:hypothetical protein
MKKNIIWILIVLISIGITYIFIPRPYVAHWHANFAVYIDGEQKDFGTDGYMEETSRCNVTTDVRAEDRIHLHDNKWSLVHVHMVASTWGDLFSNLSWGIGNSYLADPAGKIYTASGENHLYFFVNGTPIMYPANEIVKSTDRLLVWYGTGSEKEIQERADTLVAKDAEEYNHKADPASCSTNTYGWLSPIAEPIAEWKEQFFPHD